MKILYGYTNCTDKKYGELFKDKPLSVLLADQKYHSLLIKGLSKVGASVGCVSGLPINRSVTGKLFINEPDEEEDGVTYHYLKTVNFPVLRQLCIYFGTKRFIKRRVAEGEKDAYVVCDCLNIANALASLKAAKKRKIPVVFVVTDIPEFQRGKLLKRINDKMIAGADGFVFLTEQMNDKLNPQGKPYIVLEGHSDGSLPEIDPNERYEAKYGEKVVLYAGSLHKLYGIKNLVEGFVEAEFDCKLKIYGDGDYRAELEETCKAHGNVVYMGVMPNGEIVEAEQRAALLVNPRPSAPEYTKYSFPSKTMEYMASGTPVLTTRLPGIPKEYYPYVSFIEDESPSGVARALKDFLALPASFRYGLGAAARRFVIEEKSNEVQAKKITEFLRNNFNKAQ